VGAALPLRAPAGATMPLKPPYSLGERGRPTVRTGTIALIITALLAVPTLVPVGPLATSVPLRAQSLLQPLLGTPDDCVGRDAPDTVAPHALTLPADCPGTIDEGDEDAYTFLIAEAGTLLHFRLEVSPHTYYVLASDDAEGFNSFGTWGPTDRILHAPPGRYLFYLKDGGAQDTGGPYRLTLATSRFTDTPDCEGAGDAPPQAENEWPTFRSLTLPVDCGGTLDVGDPIDRFLFTTDGAHAHRVRLLQPEGAPGTVVAFVAEVSIGPSSVTWGPSRRLATTPGAASETLIVDAGAALMWSLHVARASGGAGTAIPYQLVVEREPSPAGDDCGAGIDLPARRAGAPPPIERIPGEECTGALTVGDVEDSFNLLLPEHEGVRLKVDVAADGPVAVTLRGSWVGTLTAQGSRSFELYLPPGVQRIPVSLSPATAGTDAPVAYTVTAEVQPDPQDDCGFGRDAPALTDQGLGLLFPVGPCVGRFETGDHRDGYRFDSSKGDIVSVDVTLSSRQMLTSLYRNLSAGGSTVRGATFKATYQASGPGGLEIRSDGPGSSYDLRVSRIPMNAMNDCGSGADAAASLGYLVPLRPGAGRCSGEVTTMADLQDDYGMTLVAGDTVALTMTRPADDGLATLRVQGPDGSVLDLGLGSRGVSNRLPSGDQHWVFPVLEAGLHVLTFSNAPPGPYTLEASAPLTEALGSV